MIKIIIHFPVILALIFSVLFSSAALNRSFWFLIPAWQAVCIGILLTADGKNREKRYRKILYLVDGGKTLSSLPREKTICGFFIRLAVLWQTRPGVTRQKI